MEVLNHVLVVKKDNLKMFLSTICHIEGFLVLSRSRWTLFQALFFLFLCLFLSSLKRLKPMETFSKQLIFSFKCLLNITDRNLYEKIVRRIYKRQNVVIFGVLFSLFWGRAHRKLARSVFNIFVTYYWLKHNINVPKSSKNLIFV